MSLLLARLARTLSKHWKRSLAVAIAVVVALGVMAGTSEPAAEDFSIPGTESQQALDLLSDHTPALAGSEATVVFSTEQGRLTDSERRSAVEAALEEIQGLEGVAEVADPFADEGMLSGEETVAAVEVRYETEPLDLEPSDSEQLQEAAESAESAGIQTSARGMVIDIGAQPEAPIEELIGIAVAIVLLTLLFRSAAAMVATLAGALIGLMVGQIMLAALARPLGIPEFATVVAVMLGLGVGIDYSLLVIARYREQRAGGDTVRDAAAKAAATAGASVVAAGLIVMVAIAGLLVIGIPLIGKMGVASAIGVAAVVISAITILPIMMGGLGRWLRPGKRAHAGASAAFTRWGQLVTGRPWISIACGAAVLLLFAAPVTQMRLGQPDDGNQPEDTTQRIAYDEISDAFGPGYNGPFLIAVDASDGGASANEDALDRLADAIEGTRGVAEVAPPAPSEDDEIATVVAIPTTAPQDAATSELLDRLRGNVIPTVTEGTPLTAYVGGNTAGFEDFSAKVAERLPVFIAAVIGLSVILLMMAFRSLWIPLISAVFNILSVGAAFGVVTGVFQEGIGASLVGADSGIPIVSFIPVMIFAILFGLSMDYNVFLLSRVHEAYNEGDSPPQSVVHGLERVGKVVLFMGLIMASVFAAFSTSPDVMVKMMGLGLGAAILIDVTIVRLVVAPAVVTLLGHRAWWLPGWLDRLMPNISLEGHLVQGEDEAEALAHGQDESEARAGAGNAPRTGG